MNAPGMRPSLLVAVAFLLVAVGPLAAQGATNAVDLSVGLRDGQQRASAMLSRRWPLVGGVVSIGVGARVTRYRGDAIAFARIGEGAAFAPDELVLEPRVVAGNLAVIVGARLLGRLGIGANLDLVGYATGKAVSTAAGEAAPDAVSYFQNGTGDRGSLNSEVYGALRLSRDLTMRAGLSHYVVGYEADSIEGTSRYQRFTNVTFVALRLDL